MPFFAALIAMLVFFSPAAAAAGLDAMPVEEAIPFVFSRLSQDAQDGLGDVMEEMAEARRVKKARRDALGKLQIEVRSMQNQSAKDAKQRRIDRLRAKVADTEKRQRKVLDMLEQRHAAEQAKLAQKRDRRAQQHRKAEKERQNEERERLKEMEREKAGREADAEKQRRQQEDSAEKQSADDRESNQENIQDSDSKPAQKKTCPSAQPDCRRQSRQGGGDFNTRPAPKGLGDGQNSGAGYPATTHPELLPAPPMELYRPK